MVDKVALGQVSSEYCGFPANSHSTNCYIIIIYHLGLVQQAKQWPPMGEIIMKGLILYFGVTSF
jgi:hypothetical protein